MTSLWGHGHSMVDQVDNERVFFDGKMLRIRLPAIHLTDTANIVGFLTLVIAGISALVVHGTILPWWTATVPVSVFLILQGGRILIRVIRAWSGKNDFVIDLEAKRITMPARFLGRPREIPFSGVKELGFESVAYGRSFHLTVFTHGRPDKPEFRFPVYFTDEVWAQSDPCELLWKVCKLARLDYAMFGEWR